MQAWHFLFILVFLVYILSDFFSQVVLQSPVNLDDPIYRRKVQRPLIAPLLARSVLGSHSRACDFARDCQIHHAWRQLSFVAVFACRSAQGSRRDIAC